MTKTSTKTRKKPTKSATTTKRPNRAKKATVAGRVEKVPVHQWVNADGKILILRFSDKQGRSHKDFQHPMTVGEAVTAPDWNPQPVCGGGIHGWAWGIGIGDGKEPDWNDGLWQVYGVKPEDVSGNIDGEIKCKFKTGTLCYAGDWYGAMLFILDGQKRWVESFSEEQGHATGYRSASSATGDRSASSATGYRSASSATGDSSASSATGYSSASSATGDSSASSATGYSSASSATGDRSASSATGDSSASSATGKASVAVSTGLNSRARAGEYGMIALAWYNGEKDRVEMRCAEVGCGDGTDGKLKAGTWYCLDDAGQFVEYS